jgi:hypothetical protein
MMDSIT